MKQQIYVAHAEDHKIYRDGIKMALKGIPDIVYLFEAENGLDLTRKLNDAEKLPDIILMDIRMPEIDGINLLPLVKIHYPSIKVIMLTMYDEREMVIKCMDLGADGFLTKTSPPEEIPYTIWRVYHGKKVFDLLERRNYIE